MDENQFQIKEEKPDDINSEGNLVTQHLDIKEERIEEIVAKVPNIKNENFVDIIDIKNEKNGDHSDQIFSSEEIDPLLNIYDTNTIDEKAFKCETCMTFFATRKELNLHYATFLGNCYKEKSSAVYEERKMFECQFLGCESRFTSYENLRNHMKFSKNHIDIVHEKDTPEHQCTYCEFKSDSKTKLTIHIRANHEEIRLVCALCNKTLKSKDSLNEHIAWVHEGKSQYDCSLGSYKCAQNSRMDEHIEEVHEKKNRESVKSSAVHEERKIFECQVLGCESRFTSNGDLRKHISKKHIDMAHEKDKPEYQCTYCDFKFHSKTKLNIHIRANHEEIRFVCALCNKTFKRKDYLNAHIAWGHEEKSQYDCSLCSYKCEQKSRMDRHVEEVHEKKNRLKCELCTKTFSASACMTAHVAAVHEKVKPEHQCQYCDFKSDSDISK